MNGTCDEYDEFIISEKVETDIGKNKKLSTREDQLYNTIKNIR